MSMIEDSSEPKEAGDSLAEDVDGIEDGEDMMVCEREEGAAVAQMWVKNERTKLVRVVGSWRHAPNTRPTTRGIKKNAVT